LVFAYFAPEEHLTLSALQEHFDLAEQDREECQMLASTLAPWCRGGNCGVLFDGATNVATSERVVHYELGFIGESAKEIKAVVGFIQINSIRNRVMLMPRHLKKRIVVEEVSRFLDVPGGEAILRECFEQFRKFNVQVIIVAQQYSRIADTPIRAAIVGNARAWIIFNTGDRLDVERLGVDLGLSRVAVETILRFPRPDQQTGVKYSEFLYYHTDTVRPICGTVRYYRLPTGPTSTTNETSKQT
jgi:type IV secretory pathway VirB4 component